MTYTGINDILKAFFTKLKSWLQTNGEISKLTNARVLKISDFNNSNTSDGTKFDGSADIILKLPNQIDSRIQTANHGTSFIKGRDIAIVRTGAASTNSWFPILSIGAENYNFELGQLSGETACRLVASADANYSSDTNIVTFIVKFNSDGSTEFTYIKPSRINIPTSKPSVTASGDIWIE